MTAQTKVSPARQKQLERLMAESEARSDKLRQKWLNELHTAAILRLQMEDTVKS
jgi:hypothetical protein